MPPQTYCYHFLALWLGVIISFDSGLVQLFNKYSNLVSDFTLICSWRPISQYIYIRSGKWLDAKQVITYYLDQYWIYIYTYICARLSMSYRFEYYTMWQQLRPLEGISYAWFTVTSMQYMYVWHIYDTSKEVYAISWMTCYISWHLPSQVSF